MIRIFVAAFMAVCLAACSTVPNPLTPAQRDSFFVQDAAVVWGAKDPKKPNPAYDAAVADMKVRLKEAVEREFKNSPAGAEPVTFRVNVTDYNGSTYIRADVDVVRISDGQVIGSYKKVTGVHVNNGGLLGVLIEAAMKPDYVGMVSNLFAADLRLKFQSK